MRLKDESGLSIYRKKKRAWREIKELEEVKEKIKRHSSAEPTKTVELTGRSKSKAKTLKISKYNYYASKYDIAFRKR